MTATLKTDGKKGIGNAIKELMILQGVTGREIAEALGTSLPTIYDKLSYRTISADDLVRILDVLGLQLAAVEDADLVKIFTLDMCAPRRHRKKVNMEKFYQERYHTPKPRPYDPAIAAAYERSAEKRRAKQNDDIVE